MERKVCEYWKGGHFIQAKKKKKNQMHSSRGMCEHMRIKLQKDSASGGTGIDTQQEGESMFYRDQSESELH